MKHAKKYNIPRGLAIGFLIFVLVGLIGCSVAIFTMKSNKIPKYSIPPIDGMQLRVETMGVITYTESPATEKPTVAPGTYTFILGDADGDGVVTIIDATKIQRVLVDLDRDEDGMISLRGIVDDEDILNILHATKIQRYLADFDVDEPIGEEITRVIS